MRPKSVVVGARVSPEMGEMLTKAAEERGFKNVSAVVRRAIEFYVAQHGLKEVKRGRDKE